MPSTWKTVPVFISSTFRDMHAERDHLVRFIFPRLREELLKRRVHLVEVDLRWGVTAEQDALRVCREVIDECRPRFLCILGGRYGWTPPGQDRSITADEIHYAALDDPGLRDHCFFYFRDPRATEAMAEQVPGEFCEPPASDRARQLDELKHAIVAAGFEPFVYSAHWDRRRNRLAGLEALGERVCADLLASIDRERGVAAEEAAPHSLAEENAAMESFAAERTQQYVVGSRQPLLNELTAFASSRAQPNALVLTGEPGSGKSALLGYFYRQYTAAHPEEIVLAHFVGASEGSTSVRRMLQRLCAEIEQAVHNELAEEEREHEIPDDFPGLCEAFLRLLVKAARRKRVVIVLDALEPARPGRRGTPAGLASRGAAGERAFRPVVAAPPRPGDATSAGRPRREATLPLLSGADAEAIIAQFLGRYHKRMSGEQVQALLAKPEGSNPLYLLMALEELRTLGSFEELTDRVRTLPGGVKLLFLHILQDRLTNDPGFRDETGRPVGAQLVQQFVCLLGVSRHGLSQAELVDLPRAGRPAG